MTAASQRVPGRAAEAASKLKRELADTPSIGVQTDQAITFEAIRVTGPASSLFVGVHEDDFDNAYYLASVEGSETCETLGSSREVTAVAGIIRMLQLEITGKCQLACGHCYADAGPDRGHGSMTAAD